MLVSPAEPAQLRSLGRVSPLPEKLGCDFLVPCHGGFAGAQRKEVKDLRASAGDGRLGKEITQLKTGNIHPALLVVEGRVKWTSDGRIADPWGRQWNRSQWYGVLWSVQLAGLWVVQTDSMTETARALETFERWAQKDEHGSLAARGAAPSIWGAHQTNRDWGIWVLQGFNGIGVKMAEKIWDHFEGLPFAWKKGVTVERLCEIDGMGPKTARKFYELMGGEE